MPIDQNQLQRYAQKRRQAKSAYDAAVVARLDLEKRLEAAFQVERDAKRVFDRARELENRIADGETVTEEP